MRRLIQRSALQLKCSISARYCLKGYMKPAPVAPLTTFLFRTTRETEDSVGHAHGYPITSQSGIQLSPIRLQ